MSFDIRRNPQEKEISRTYRCLKCGRPCTLEDAPAHTEGWEERFESNRPPKDWLGDSGYDEDDVSDTKEFGYKHYCGQTHTIHEVTDWGNIKKFIKSERELLKREIVEAISKEEDSLEEMIYSFDCDPKSREIAKGVIDDITNIINNIK